MGKYRAVYKCRLCGGTYRCPTCTAEHDNIVLAMLCMELGIKTGKQLERPMTITHDCEGGHMGLADFQGWEMEV